MATVVELLRRERADPADQVVVLPRATWKDFERILAIRGDAAVPRLAYLAGDIELMSPSRTHEILKGTLGRLLEAYAEERGVELVSAGSWTVKRPRRESAAEPDECYLVGDPGERDVPDLAIEVVWTSGGIDKLDVYRRLGVGEVWFWRRGRLEVFVLGRAGYARVRASALFPDLDLEDLAAYVSRTDQTQAVREYRASLRRRPVVLKRLSARKKRVK